MIKIISIGIFVLATSIFDAKPGVKHEVNKVNTSEKNYWFFSNVLVYPMLVSTDFTVLNAGDKKYMIDIMDSNSKVLFSFHSSPYSKTTLGLKSFENSEYIIRMKNSEETHQFRIIKST